MARALLTEPNCYVVCLREMRLALGLMKVSLVRCCRKASAVGVVEQYLPG